MEDSKKGKRGGGANASPSKGDTSGSESERSAGGTRHKKKKTQIPPGEIERDVMKLHGQEVPPEQPNEAEVPAESQKDSSRAHGTHEEMVERGKMGAAAMAGGGKGPHGTAEELAERGRKGASVRWGETRVEGEEEMEMEGEEETPAPGKAGASQAMMMFQELADKMQEAGAQKMVVAQGRTIAIDCLYGSPAYNVLCKFYKEKPKSFDEVEPLVWSQPICSGGTVVPREQRLQALEETEGMLFAYGPIHKEQLSQSPEVPLPPLPVMLPPGGMKFEEVSATGPKVLDLLAAGEKQCPVLSSMPSGCLLARVNFVYSGCCLSVLVAKS